MPGGANATAAQVEATGHDARSHWAPRGAILRRALVVAALVALDLWSKRAVFAWLESDPAGMSYDLSGRPRFLLAGEWLAFMLSRNPGMAWGFDGLPPWLLVGGRVAACFFLAWLAVRTPPARRVLTISLVLILAGAVGNLYDNLVLPPPANKPHATFGEVRDFIDVYFPAQDWHFPTFNVADACISVGAVLLFVSSFFAPRAAHATPDAGERANAA